MNHLLSPGDENSDGLCDAVPSKKLQVNGLLQRAAESARSDVDLADPARQLTGETSGEDAPKGPAGDGEPF